MTTAADKTALPELPLGERAATGMVWLSAQTGISRVTSLLAQLVLAWILEPEHFGQIGLVYTITAFATMVTNPGIEDVLLQKQKHLRRWMTAGFWMGLTCGLAGAAIMSLAGAVVVNIARHQGNAAYGNTNLLWMILILASGAPLNSLALVPLAVLRSQMRFARIAAINLGETVLQQGLLVAMAAIGMGAFSFVLPMPIVAVVRSVVLWLLVRPPIRARLCLHRWPALTTSTGWMFGQRVAYQFTAQGSTIVLGAMYADDTRVGRYFWAFVLSAQVVRVLCDNVLAVMLPALSTIHDDFQRMARAAARASRAMATMITPILVLQILLAGPIVRLLFEPKWEPAIPLVQWMSLGLVLYTAAWPMGLILPASGNFRGWFLLWFTLAIIYFVLVVPFARYGQETGVAMGVCVWSWLSALLYAIWPYGSWRGAAVLLGGVWRAFVALAGALPGALIVWSAPSTTVYDILAIAVVAPLVLGIYILLLHRMDRPAVDLLLQNLLMMRGSWLRKLHGAVAGSPQTENPT